jgi:hypothetical protein
MTDEYEPLPPWPNYRGLDPLKVIARREQLHVGAVAFRQTDTRVYLRVKGRSYASTGAPIARYAFVPYAVVAETPRSWITNASDKKFPKRDPRELFGLDDVEDFLWVTENRIDIADMIRRDSAITVNMLREVARVIGYKPKAAAQARAKGE